MLCPLESAQSPGVFANNYTRGGRRECSSFSLPGWGLRAFFRDAEILSGSADEAGEAE